MNRQDKIEFNLEKMIYKALCELPDNKSLILSDLNGMARLYFINSLDDTSYSYKLTLDSVLKRLHNREHILIKKVPRSAHHTISKGLDFDKWSHSMNDNQNSGQINIGSVNAHNVQVGNENSQIINISLHELVQKVAESNDPQAKSLVKEMLENSTVGSIVGAGMSALFNILYAKT